MEAQSQFFAQEAQKYKTELLDKVIPFWIENSIDKEYGGFYTCLDRTGSVYDTDKFMWLQGRQVWTFAMLYNNVDQKQEWLDIALLGAKFMDAYGRSEDGSWYFSLTREGKPLIVPYNIFSDCFACQAFGQLYKATGDEYHAQLARSTFEQILARKDNSKGKWTKAIAGTRPLKNFALPMILSNLAIELEHLLPKELTSQLIADCIKQVMEVFYDKESGLILENVTPEGKFSDSYEGRCLNPGHAIEAMWFITDLAARNGDNALAERAKNITLHTLEYAWDTTYGGLYYFMDIKGAPLQQLEWDQKLWWVHIETMIALLKSYQHTKDPKCLEWYKKVAEYTWAHFADNEYNEWFGYLNRQGEVLLNLKGGKWKGCYHVPRGMYQCWQVCETLSK